MVRGAKPARCLRVPPGTLNCSSTDSAGAPSVSHGGSRHSSNPSRSIDVHDLLPSEVEHAESCCHRASEAAARLLVIPLTRPDRRSSRRRSVQSCSMDVNFDRGEVVIRRGKGRKDRRVMLPASLRAPLLRHLADVAQLHDKDLAAGLGRVVMPDALDRKCPNAATTWLWQFIFPAGHICRDERYGLPSRFHLQRDRRSAGGHGGGPHGRLDQARHVPHVSSFLCDAFARGGIRHSNGSGTARPRGCQYHDDRHARPQSRCPGRPKPRRSLVAMPWPRLAAVVCR